LEKRKESSNKVDEEWLIVAILSTPRNHVVNYLYYLTAAEQHSLIVSTDLVLHCRCCFFAANTKSMRRQRTRTCNKMLLFLSHIGLDTRAEHMKATAFPSYTHSDNNAWRVTVGKREI